MIKNPVRKARKNHLFIGLTKDKNELENTIDYKKTSNEGIDSKVSFIFI